MQIFLYFSASFIHDNKQPAALYSAAIRRCAMKPDSGKRIFYYDFLRVISALAVVWIHTSGISVGTQPVGSSAWLVSLFYDAGVHWAVPIFVMISGVLFLGSDKKSNWKVMLTKNIRHLFILYIIWSLVYSILAFAPMAVSDPVSFVKNVIGEFFAGGRFHLWFLPMLIGLYLAEPILHVFVKNRSLLRYFLVLGFVFCFLLPGLQKIAEMLLNESTASTYIGSVLGWCRSFEPGIGVSRNLYYFVLGYAMATCSEKKLHSSISWLLIAAGYLLNVGLIWILSMHTGKAVDYFTNTFTLMMAAGIFSLVRLKCSLGFGNKGFNRVILQLSGYTLGCYLIHMAVLNLVSPLFPQTVSVLVLLWQIPLTILIVFVLSMALSALLGHIPYLKKLVQN